MIDIDLNETVREVIGFVGATARGRHIALKCAATSVDLYVKDDAVQLQQVILNLIINAMDAISQAEAKEREVNVSTNLSAACAEISVSDTGPGMAAGDLKNIFNPFFTTKPQGMGMGLALSAPSSKPATDRFLRRTNCQVARFSRSGFRLPAADQLQPEAPPLLRRRKAVTLDFLDLYQRTSSPRIDACRDEAHRRVL